MKITPPWKIRENLKDDLREYFSGETTQDEFSERIIVTVMSSIIAIYICLALVASLSVILYFSASQDKKPKTQSECILINMKNAKNELATRFIMTSCYRQFPEKTGEQQ